MPDHLTTSTEVIQLTRNQNSETCTYEKLHLRLPTEIKLENWHLTIN